MPNYEITIYLDNGAKATVKDTAQNIDVIKAHITEELKEQDAFTLKAPSSMIVILNKNSIIGYSIDEV